MIESLAMLSAAVLIFLAVHGRLCRHWRSSGIRQRNLIRMIIIANPPLLVITVIVCWIIGFHGVDAAISACYILAGFNAFTYSYFHIFNMSESARRIRILREIRDGSQIPSELALTYSPVDMIRARLRRLEDLGQIRQDSDGNYHLVGRSLLSAAVIFQKTRSLVIGRKIRSSRYSGHFDR